MYQNDSYEVYTCVNSDKPSVYFPVIKIPGSFKRFNQSIESKEGYIGAGKTGKYTKAETGIS